MVYFWKRVPLGLVAAGALFVEFLLFSFLFDVLGPTTAPLSKIERAARLYLVPRPLITMLAAALLLGWKTWRKELSGNGHTAGGQPSRWLFLGLHLIAFGGLLQVTALFYQSDPQVGTHPGGWIALRAFLWSTWLGCWALAIFPAAIWLRLLRCGVRPLLAGFLLGLVAWKAGALASLLWSSLGRLTFMSVQGLLGLFFADVPCQPENSLVGTASFQVRIASSCSGYEGIGLVCCFLAVYQWLFRKVLRFPNALLIFPLGCTLAWLANVVRITVLITIGTLGSPDLAVKGFHSHAGWLAFNALALALVVVLRCSKFFSKPAGTPERTSFSNPEAAYLLPLLTLLAMALIMGAFCSNVDIYYSWRVLAAAGALWLVQRRREPICLRISPAALSTGVAVFVLWLALEPAGGLSQADFPWVCWLGTLPKEAAAAWLFLRIVGSVVVVPIAEELAFRGYLIRRLIAVDFEKVPLGQFSWVSWLVSSALFGALHQRWVAGTLAGLLYAWVYYREKNLSAPIGAHATSNALIAAYVLATGSWWLWSSPET